MRHINGTLLIDYSGLDVTTNYDILKYRLSSYYQKMLKDIGIYLNMKQNSIGLYPSGDYLKKMKRNLLSLENSNIKTLLIREIFLHKKYSKIVIINT